MPAWEYMYLHLQGSSLDEFLLKLNEYGSKGWEVINIDNQGAFKGQIRRSYLMRRPKS